MSLQKSIHLLVLIAWMCLAFGCSSEKESADSNGSSNDASSSGTSGNESEIPDLSDWQGDMDDMVTKLGLSEDEKSTLASTFKQQQAIYEKWMSESGEKISELEKKIRKAAKDRDLASLKQLTDEAGPLRQWMTNLLQEREKAILDSLSPEKRNQWQGHLLVERFKELTKDMNLSSEQMDKVKELALQAAKQVKDEVNPKAAGFLKLEESVELQVFDEMQKSAYEKLKKRNPLRSLKDSIFGGG